MNDPSRWHLSYDCVCVWKEHTLATFSMQGGKQADNSKVIYCLPKTITASLK